MPKPHVLIVEDEPDIAGLIKHTLEKNGAAHAAIVGSGDGAIKAFGTAAREAADEATPGVGKLFRNGGDEFVAHFPSHEHAAAFSRALSQKLEKVAPVGGAHKLSMSFGFGPDMATADKALYEAKKQKVNPQGQRAFKVGQVPNLAHSLMPGHEGPLPLHDSGAGAVHSTLHAMNAVKPAVTKPAAPPAAPKPAAAA